MQLQLMTTRTDTAGYALVLHSNRIEDENRLILKRTYFQSKHVLMTSLLQLLSWRTKMEY